MEFQTFVFSPLGFSFWKRCFIQPESLLKGVLNGNILFGNHCRFGSFMIFTGLNGNKNVISVIENCDVMGCK